MLELTATFQAILTSHATCDLGHRPEPRRSDGLFALLAQTVLAVAQALERIGQLVGPVDQQALGREAHLPVLIEPDDVYLVRQRCVVPGGPWEILQCDGSAQLADSIDRTVQF